MIETLAESKLLQYLFNEMSIERLLTWEDYDCFVFNTRGCFYATNIESKIYSDIDALRVYYFRKPKHICFPELDLNLIPEYFALKLANYIAEQKKLAGVIFDEHAAILNFIKIEIDLYQKEEINIRETNSAAAYLKKRQPTFEKFKIYVNWLNNKISGKQLKYNSFEEMFEDAILYQSIERPQNEFQKTTSINYYNLQFDIWLQKFKYYDCNNKYYYIELLTNENWVSFLHYEMALLDENKIAFDKEKVTWQPHEIPKHTETKSEQETPFSKNNFDNISIDEIYSHFKAGLVAKQYLTEQELNEYLKAAFELKTKPETLFKLKYTPTKQKIYTVFYVYYKDISQKKHKTQKKYAALLGDYFEGYRTEIIQTNWAKDYKTKR